VHYRGTFKHGGDPWYYPSAVSYLVSDAEANVWSQPCNCGAQDTYGIRFEKLSVDCGYILKAHEASIRAEEAKRIRVAYI